MSWKEEETGLDSSVGKLVETVHRRISRRNALRTAVIGGVGTFASLAVGQSPAGAISCDCGPSPRCSSGQGGDGCPSGKSLCKKPTCSCEWTSGYWVACTGFGLCKNGYELCYDCHSSGSCTICTVLSGIYCSGCCSATDLREEQHRIQESLRAQAS